MMNSETFLHPGGSLPRFEYKDDDELKQTPVWYIQGDIHWLPGGRRNGQDRPTLIRHPGVIDKQSHQLIRVKLANGIMHWLNLNNYTEARRVQRRKEI